MSMTEPPEDSRPGDDTVSDENRFRTTRWTVVLTAGDPMSPEGEIALGSLCQTYWTPVYAFIRKRGSSPEEAKDLTQGFFAKFLNKNLVSRAERTRGRFRSFLMSSVENFLRDEHDRNTTLKRGGGQIRLSLDWGAEEGASTLDLSESLTPAEAFEKQWARTLLDSVMKRLTTEYRENGQAAIFEELQRQLWGDSDSISYAELSERFRMSVVNLRVVAHRMRQRFREILREEVGQTVGSAREIDDEIRYLKRILSS